MREVTILTTVKEGTLEGFRAYKTIILENEHAVYDDLCIEDKKEVKLIRNWNKKYNDEILMNIRSLNSIKRKYEETGIIDNYYIHDIKNINENLENIRSLIPWCMELINTGRINTVDYTEQKLLSALLKNFTKIRNFVKEIEAQLA